jgi:hypothetical protein
MGCGSIPIFMTGWKGLDIAALKALLHPKVWAINGRSSTWLCRTEIHTALLL